MTPHDILFIRACKVEDPLRRLDSLYRRRYGKSKNHYPALLHILSDLIVKYGKPMSPLDVIATIRAFDNETNSKSCCLALLYNLRNLSIKQLPENFIKPKRFR